MYVDATTERSIAEAVEGLQVGANEAAVVLVGQGTPTPLKELVATLQSLDLPFIGGIFPGLAAGGDLHRRGALVFKVPVLAPPRLYRDIHLDTPAIEVPVIRGEGQPTLFTLIDGISPGISSFLDQLYGAFGSTVRYFGGGAGVYLGESAGPFSFAHTPCVFTNEGVARDAAAICLVDQAVCLGVRHGWRHVAGPFVATRTAGNLMLELDWQNAFEVYKRAVEADSGRDLTRKAFFDLARTYPFGLIKEGGDDIVRVVIGVTEDDELITGAEVLENSAVDILKGTPATLLAAAGFAANESMFCDGLPEQVLVITCVSRWLIMGDEFDNELALIQSRVQAHAPGHQALGVLSLGEIASDGDRLLEFLNKTVAVGAFHD